MEHGAATTLLERRAVRRHCLVKVNRAWLDSANTPVGYPMVNVRDIESAKVKAERELFGADEYASNLRRALQR